METFVNRIRAIDEEVNALTDLRRIVNDFLMTMMQNGITKISALPLLYESMEKQLDSLEIRKTGSYKELAAISDRLSGPVQPFLVQLPSMRVLSSCLKENRQISDTEGFSRWVQMHGIPSGRPGAHERFESRTEAGNIILLKLPETYQNNSPYLDTYWEGGLFAAANLYLDEDMDACFRGLLSAFDNNPYYEIDYTHDGRLRQEPLLEDLISPDSRRELVSLLVPVKKRLPDPRLFKAPEEIPPDSITPEEIELANPVLWSKDVPMDRLIPINHPHYRVTEQGEAEYISWISTRVLSTNVEVRLPFRVDIDFRIREESGGWLFIGEKKRTVDLAQVYRDIIIDMPRLLTIKTDEFCFGPEAFRAWAGDIEGGKFDTMSLECFDDGWDSHISNICNMATNGSCVFTFLDRARELNPDFAFLEDIGRQYRRTAEIWNNDNGNDLEALGGGFNVTLSNLRDKTRRCKIAGKIREAAACMDTVLEILNENLPELLQTSTTHQFFS